MKKRREELEKELGEKKRAKQVISLHIAVFTICLLKLLNNLVI